MDVHPSLLEPKRSPEYFDNCLTVVLAYLTGQLGFVCLSPSVRHNLVQTVSE
jgi:hypothetical protein